MSIRKKINEGEVRGQRVTGNSNLNLIICQWTEKMSGLNRKRSSVLSSLNGRFLKKSFLHRERRLYTTYTQGRLKWF